MTFSRIKQKGILSKLLERAIKILLKKECNKIGNLKIEIIASSIQIIKGIIKKINIIAKDIDYKDLLFDEIEIEANEVRIIFKLNSKKLLFDKNFRINFKIFLSEESLKKILLSSNWKWTGDLIAKEILNQNRLDDLKIKEDQILIKTSNKNNNIDDEEKINLKAKDGKIYLENNKKNKSFKIPIEDKVCIKDINIKNNLIIIFADSTISF